MVYGAFCAHQQLSNIQKIVGFTKIYYAGLNLFGNLIVGEGCKVFGLEAKSSGEGLSV
jgi:hypothetical protein